MQWIIEADIARFKKLMEDAGDQDRVKIVAHLRRAEARLAQMRKASSLAAAPE